MNVSTILWLRRVGRAAHLLLWAILVCALIVVGAPTIYHGAAIHTVRNASAYHSADTFLSFVTEVPCASEELISIYQALPPSRPVIIFTVKSDPRSFFLAMLNSYLAAPHPVRLVDVADRRAPLPRMDDAAAVVFCYVSRPPWMPAGKVFGARLEIAPLLSTAKR